MQDFPSKETKFIFKGPIGNLEVLITPALYSNTLAILCHPHPLFGGTMTNKVVTTMAKTFHEMGIHTLRFNFRGVGQSEGVHDGGIGETNDVVALAAWVKTVLPDSHLWIGGFSFGGFVAARAALELLPDQLVSIAPQVSRFKETHLATPKKPWLIIQGEKDEVIAPEEVYAWVDELDPKPNLIRIPEASHFFHGKLTELRLALRKGLI